MRELRIKYRWYQLIASGEKTLEARANYDSLHNIRIGQVLHFISEELCTEVTITDIRRYNTLESMLEKEELSKLLPGITTLQDALIIYQNIYSAETIRREKGMIVFAFIRNRV